MCYVILAKPNDEPPFLAMTYGGLLPNVGFNAYGIAQLIDSVYPDRFAHWHPASGGCTRGVGLHAAFPAPSGAPSCRTAPPAITT